MKKQNFHSLYVLVSCCMWALIAWWPTRLLPYHWDGAEFFINSARYFYTQGFWPLIARFSEFAHPPLLQLIVALSWKIFGPSIVVTHAVFWSFLPMLLYSSYRIGKKLSNSYHVGCLVAATLGLTPFVLSEYGMTYIDLPAAALVVTGLAILLDGYFRWALVFFSLAVMVKFTVMPLVIAAGIIWYRQNHGNRRLIKSLLLVLVPGILVVSYLFYHYSVTGWWLVTPDRPSAMPTSLASLVDSVRFVVYALLWRQQRWLLVIFLGIGLLVLKNRHKLTEMCRLWWYFLLTIIVTIFVFAATGEFAPRYAIYLLPLWYAVVFTVIKQAVRKLFPLHLAGLLVVLLFAFNLHPKEPITLNYEFRNNEDLSYLDHIEVAKAASRWLSEKYPGALIYSGFPQSYQLTQPYQGYVEWPLKFSGCQDFLPHKNSTQLIYLYPYHYTSMACDDILRQNKTTLLRKFPSGRIWAAIYKIGQ